MLARYIGDRQFYRRAFAVILPILVQNVITNFVSLIDNVMVGRVGTEPMSGVAIVNQLLFVYILAIFGVQAAGGIFGAQFFGKGDDKGVADTVLIKLAVTLIVVAASYAIFFLFGDRLILAFLHEGGEGLDLAATFGYARGYMNIMLWELVPFGICQVVAGTLRETNETALPMKAGIVAVLVNLVFNYILIYGKFGAPALGVVGAAIATILSRFVECAIILIWVFAHRDRNRFVDHLLHPTRMTPGLVKQAVILGTPMFFNELLWSAGMTVLNQNMSLRGLEVVSAINISSTVSNLFGTAYLAMGTALSILVGQALGAGDIERAVDEDNKLIALQIACGVAVAAVMILLAPVLTRLYNTTDAVRSLSTVFIRISSLYMPMDAAICAYYFTLRSGGKTFITFLFDSFFVWVCSIPIAFCLAHFTGLPIVPIYAIVYGANVIKFIIGLVLVRRRSWVNNLVSDEKLRA